MNIYVGNLNYRVTENDLQSVFEEYGSVSQVKIISDKMTRRSKGFGFVVMDNDTEAQAAIDELNGTTYQNRDLVVNQAREKKQY